MLHTLANVQQRTIKPIIEAAVAAGSLVHTDEYGIYARLPAWGYRHKTVCHGRGEYARDEDGDGFCKVHVNTLEADKSLEGNARDQPSVRLKPVHSTSHRLMVAVR